jgi:hypothetical protein
MGFWSCADRLYEGFYAADDGPVDDFIDISVLPHGQLPGTVSPVSTAAPTIGENGQLELVHAYGTANWDRQRRRGCVRLIDWDDHRGATAPDYVCHSLVATLVAHRLLDREGCLVHAASVVRGGNGYLFVGPSGAGKSTIARLSAPTHSVLGDDTSLIAQSHGEFRLCGTPFLRQFRSVEATDCAPLVAICFLHQATTHALLPISKSRAVWQLSKSIRYAAQYYAGAQALLDLAVKVCDLTPCYQLDFLPDDSFWNCFDD